MYKIDDLVIYSNPINEIESSLIFKVINVNDITDRYLCECQNLPGFKSFKPVSLFGSEHIKPFNN